MKHARSLPTTVLAITPNSIAIEDRIDRRLQEHTDQIHELQDKVDFFVRTSLPPVEQVFFEGEFFEAVSF